jgi:hypothetical protein
VKIGNGQPYEVKRPFSPLFLILQRPGISPRYYFVVVGGGMT